jgi:hypothetical protein
VSGEVFGGEGRRGGRANSHMQKRSHDERECTREPRKAELTLKTKALHSS